MSQFSDFQVRTFLQALYLKLKRQKVAFNYDYQQDLE